MDGPTYHKYSVYNVIKASFYITVTAQSREYNSWLWGTEYDFALKVGAPIT